MWNHSSALVSVLLLKHTVSTSIEVNFLTKTHTNEERLSSHRRFGRRSGPLWHAYVKRMLDFIEEVAVIDVVSGSGIEKAFA